MALSPEILVGQNIRWFRKQQKLTQDALADKMFMDRAAISRYENGMNGMMSIDILLRFCSALQVTPNDLMLERNGKQHNPYDYLSPEYQKMADSVIEGLYLRQQCGS